MKGYLKKVEAKWFVVYDQRTMQDPSAEDGILPLHPKNALYLDMNLTSTTFLNKEIEFQEIALVDKIDSYQNFVFKTYAQFITTDSKKRNFVFSDDHSVDTNKMVSKQSSIEWLIETFKLTNVDLSHHKLIIEQAKEMHEEEVITAWGNGWVNGDINQNRYEYMAQEYYNEIFKTK